ncbi:MAG: AsmA-like C-terminal region-containing protein [Verrucomicrobiota bacterium]|nr:AsmA-like C-terminal region-containing protein [Limisphaera sp.]MDW8382658.1 AsmA-like C-terminal region-containing protein [Verrucomicrobiota bacterium]
MASRLWRRVGRGCRLAFRACRWLFWALLLVLLGTLLLLDHVGLPASWKTVLQEQVRRQGLDLEFARLRLRLISGVVADHVLVRPTGEGTVPRLEAEQVRLDLNFGDLFRGRFSVEGLDIVKGRFIGGQDVTTSDRFPWPVDQIQARVLFLPDGTWELQEFRAKAGPIRCTLSGRLRQAIGLRQWPHLALRPKVPAGEGDSASQLSRSWRQWWAQWDVSEPVELRGRFEIDALHPETLELQLQVRAPRVSSPRVRLERLWIRAMTKPGVSKPSAPTRLPSWQVELQAVEATMPDVRAEQLRKLRIRLEAEPSAEEPLWHVTGTGEVETVRALWGKLTRLRVETHAVASPTPFSLTWLRWQVTAEEVETDLARIESLHLSGEGQPRLSTGPTLEAEPWRWWASWQFSTSGRVDRVALPDLTLHALEWHLQWHAPELVLEHLVMHFPSGPVSAEARFRADSDELQVRLHAEADPRHFDRWLTERSRRWLDQFQWDQPPRIETEARVKLPAWPWQSTAWSEVWRSGISLAGHIELLQARYRGFKAERVSTHFHYENGTWRFSDLIVQRPDGQVQADYRVRPWERDYQWRFRWQLPLEAVAPLLGSNQLHWLTFYRGQYPILVEGEVRGAFLQPESVAGECRIVCTNFLIRDLPVDRFEAMLGYTNGRLRLLEPRLERAEGRMTAQGLTLDFATQHVHFTNLLCHDGIDKVAAAIGPRTARVLAPYRFETPPLLHLEGTVPFRGMQGADLRVTVDGKAFRWWRLNLAGVRGNIHWKDHQICLTNVQAQGYGGRLAGWAWFDESAAVGTDFRYELTATEIDLSALMRDLQPKPSRVEGLLDLHLVMHHGNTADWRTWNGSGEAVLRDGWLWSIPVFGVLSAPLDALVPGLGRSRVTSGRASFSITHGVLRSEDLECRAAAMRLLYRGQLGLDGRLDAVVQAELLRDTWLVGRVLSLALWPVSKVFECRITGTLAEPKVELLHVPRVLTIPLRPLQTLRDWLESPHSSSAQP